MNQHSIDLNADMGESFGAWQMGDDAAQHDVLEDVGEIAGVIGMAIIHGIAT